MFSIRPPLSTLRPLGIIPRPVLVRSQVDPRIAPHEGDDYPVGQPWHPGLEVIHDSQRLRCPLVATNVGIKLSYCSQNRLLL